MKKVIVLGAGLVGKEMAIDLSGKLDVTAVDINEDALGRIARQGVKTQQLDFTNEERLKNIIAGADLVVGAVPGFLGFQTVKRVIEAGKNMVDISFFPEDPFELERDSSRIEHQGAIVIERVGLTGHCTKRPLRSRAAAGEWQV